MSDDLKRSRDYWIKRASKMTWQRYNDFEKENKELIKFYNQAIDQVERELAKLAIKLKSNPTLTNQHDKRRLEKLKKQMDKIVTELTANIESFTKEQLIKAVEDQYRDMAVLLGNNDFAGPNKELIKTMMDNPWSGANFGDRLWRNKSLLEFNLNEVLTRGFIQGKTVAQIAEELSQRMSKNIDVCLRLVRTERMHYLNETAKKAYQDVGVEQLMYWAAEDERTCATCGGYHEEIMPANKVPILPLHPNCRCTYIPIIE